MFGRYALRTTDLEAALRFYADAVGVVIPPSGAERTSALEASPLPEQARARGAPPHWLGLLSAPDVERVASRLVALGGQRLGPTVRGRDGAAFATLRDPFGAVVAVREDEPVPSSSVVVWHQLHARDAARAWAVYADLFGWSDAGVVDAPDVDGGHRTFAFREDGRPRGSVANTARWPGVHTHWLFYFAVDDAELSVARVRALGGTARAPALLPDGTVLVACEDPQGAAFGLARLA